MLTACVYMYYYLHVPRIFTIKCIEQGECVVRAWYYTVLPLIHIQFTTFRGNYKDQNCSQNAIFNTQYLRTNSYTAQVIRVIRRQRRSPGGNHLTIKKKPSNKLKIRLLSETSILYLIRHASDCGSSPVKMTMPTAEHCLKKNSGPQWARTSNLWIPSPTRSLLSYVGRYVEWDLNFYCTVL